MIRQVPLVVDQLEDLVLLPPENYLSYSAGKSYSRGYLPAQSNEGFHLAFPLDSFFCSMDSGSVELNFCLTPFHTGQISSAEASGQ